MEQDTTHEGCEFLHTTEYLFRPRTGQIWLTSSCPMLLQPVWLAPVVFWTDGTPWLAVGNPVPWAYFRAPPAQPRSAVSLPLL